MFVGKLKPGRISARQFFSDVCPALVSKANDISGRFGFIIRGEAHGRWTLDFDGRSVLPSVARDRVDVCIDIATEDFTALLEGRLDVLGAFNARRLVITGEQGRLSQLSKVIS